MLIPSITVVQTFQDAARWALNAFCSASLATWSDNVYMALLYHLECLLLPTHDQQSLAATKSMALCCHYCCHHSTFATFRQATATAASSKAATVAASLLTSLMISEYLMSLPSCTSAGFLLRMNGRSLCSMLPAENIASTFRRQNTVSKLRQLPSISLKTTQCCLKTTWPQTSMFSHCSKEPTLGSCSDLTSELQITLCWSQC